MKNNNLIRFILIITNIFFLMIGICSLVAGFISKHNTYSVESKLDTSEIALIAMGIFISIVSLFGIIGVLYTNKCFLIIHLIIVMTMFTLHGIALIILFAEKNQIEIEYKVYLKKNVNSLKINTTSDFNEKCKVMKALSTIFNCCGFNGTNDFTTDEIKIQCCLAKQMIGCGQHPIDVLKNWTFHFFVIPSCVVLVIELSSILFVPFFLVAIKW